MFHRCLYIIIKEFLKITAHLKYSQKNDFNKEFFLVTKNLNFSKWKDFDKCLIILCR